MEDKFPNYMDFVKDAKSFNNQLSSERRLRMPFIDTQTGIAQNDCFLWRSECDRRLIDARNHLSCGIYISYPGTRWFKRRRDCSMRPISESAGIPGYSLATNTNPSNDLNPYNHYRSDLTYSKVNNALTSSSSSLVGQTRADSTGSHSCNTADSDSRDLSMATSQSSYDSPKDHIEEDHDMNQFDTSTQLSHSSNGFSVNDVEHKTQSNGESIVRLELQSQKQQSIFEKQTKAAIRFQSKISKKRNIGQSLIRSNSILVKDGRKTNNNADNCNNPGFEDNHGLESGQKLDVIERKQEEGVSERETSASLFPKTNSDRPYVCTLCDQTYKTRPGLSYHFLHTHNSTLPKSAPVRKKDPKKYGLLGSIVLSGEKSGKLRHEISSKLDRTKSLRARSISETTKSDRQDNSNEDAINSADTQPDNGLVCELNLTIDGASINSDDKQASPTSTIIESHTDSTQSEDLKTNTDLDTKSFRDSPRASPLRQNPFCDFCLGTVERNRRTRLPEKLVSCSKCGSSGHPTCLRFSDNIIISVRKYDWQCIECKTCSTCNNADNEHQLLFCDDCDRSYHTYCLSPPLAELPEGNWSCSSCLKEYHQEVGQESINS